MTQVNGSDYSGVTHLMTQHNCGAAVSLLSYPVKVERETEKAVKVVQGSRWAWLPKSALDGHAGAVMVSYWAWDKMRYFKADEAIDFV